MFGLWQPGKPIWLHPAVFLVEVFDAVRDEIVHRRRAARRRSAQQTVVGVDELHVGLIHGTKTENEFFRHSMAAMFKTFQTEMGPTPTARHAALRGPCARSTEPAATPENRPLDQL